MLNEYVGEVWLILDIGIYGVPPGVTTMCLLRVSGYTLCFPWNIHIFISDLGNGSYDVIPVSMISDKEMFTYKMTGVMPPHVMERLISCIDI